MSVARAKATDPEVILCYFDMLEKALIEYDLQDKPNKIFNIDETGMPLEHCPTNCYKERYEESMVMAGKKGRQVSDVS